MGSIGVAPVQVLSTTAYLQTHALASNYGQSLSLQMGRPDVTGLIHQYNYRGVKCTSMKLECGTGEYLIGTYTVDGQAFEQRQIGCGEPIEPVAVEVDDADDLAVGLHRGRHFAPDVRPQ